MKIVLKDKKEKKKQKEINIIKKFITRKLRNKSKYINKRILRKKFKNAQSFTNVDFVSDKGIIKLKDNTCARVFSVDAIDLSLTSNIQKIIFLIN